MKIHRRARPVWFLNNDDARRDAHRGPRVARDDFLGEEWVPYSVCDYERRILVVAPCAAVSDIEQLVELVVVEVPVMV